jgi:hypothetical protein
VAAIEISGFTVRLADPLLRDPRGIEALAVSDAVITGLKLPDPVTDELEH